MFTHTIKDEFLSDKDLLFVIKMKHLSVVTDLFFVICFDNKENNENNVF